MSISVSEAIELSKELAKAPQLLPKHAKTAAEILAVILAGAELGWGAMASLRSLQLVSGKLTLDASAMLGLVVRAGIEIAWEHDGSDGVAQLKLVRGKMSHVQRFTRDDAKRAGLNSDTWRKYEPSMLRARCVSSAVRAFCPDVLAGAYLPGEHPDDDVPEAPARVEPVAAPTNPERDAAVAMAAEHGFREVPERHSKEEEIAALVKVDLPNCGTLEQLSAWARELISLHGDVRASDPWRAFQARCVAVEVNPRAAVESAKKAAA